MPEILIYGVVGDSWDGLDAATLAPKFLEGEDDLVIRINSPGGYVFEGLAIYNALKAVDRKVIVHIDGLAASMASVIALAGDEIHIADNALYMIHNPWDVAIGDARELRKAAETLDKVKSQLVGIYVKASGKSEKEVSDLMDAETWFTAQEALDAGFVTNVEDGSKAKACDVSEFGFRKAPDQLLAALATGKPAQPAALTGKDRKMPQGNNPAGGKQPAPQTEDNNSTLTPEQIAENAVKAERERASAIRAAVTKARLPEAFAIELIDGGVSVDDARAKIIDKLADADDATPTRGNAPIAITGDQRDKWMRGAQNALLQRAGLTGLIAAAAEIRKEKVDLDPGEFRGIRNVELARMALDNAGIRESSYDRDRIVASALTARNSITQTTSDFPVLLENVMYKVLQAAYMTAPDTWSRFCGIGSVVDFRAHNRYLRGTFGALDSLSESGEYLNRAIPDAARESITASPKGNIINLSRVAIVNDDMDAFSGLAVDLGRAAKLSIEVDVYAALAQNGGAGPTMRDGQPLFHATHNNILAAAAPSVAAFDAARVAMASQKDVSGNEFLDIRPFAWLGPIALGGGARVINNAEYDPDANNKLQRPNMVRGLFTDIVDTPRLAGTAWYGFADPSLAPALEVAFLNGQQEPFLESRDGWRVDGTEWKVRMDYGVGAVNWRSAVRNPG